MKKSTLAMAILLAGMSTAIITPAYAEDTNNDAAAGCAACPSCNGTDAPVTDTETPAPEPAAPATPDGDTN